tara:strand:+ start:2160 stop:3182 length:1023 start_codon:yes stop_codon:yes gene_type:complete
MSEDPYRVLDVDKDSTDAEIKRSYRKLARQHHPDRNPGDAAAEERFKAIQAAYDTIGTAAARKEYDQQRRMEEMFARGGNPFSGFGGGGRGGNPFASGGFGGGFGSTQGGFDFSDILNQFMGGTDPQFQHGRGQGRAQTRQPPQPPPQRGPDIEAGIDINLQQALSGTKIEFGHRRLRICKRCNGNSFNSRKTCPQCSGKGVESRSSTITVNVPSGAQHGQQLRLKKMGHEHPQGEAGDLLITIRLDAEEGRRWEGGRLIQEVAVPYSTLMLGGKIRIRTPAGKRVQLEVANGTRIGDRRRLAGHGHDGGPLDIEFVLAEPEQVSDEQHEALDKLRESGL